jgi:hypothetical protein
MNETGNLILSFFVSQWDYDDKCVTTRQKTGEGGGGIAEK